MEIKNVAGDSIRARQNGSQWLRRGGVNEKWGLVSGQLPFRSHYRVSMSWLKTEL